MFSIVNVVDLKLVIWSEVKVLKSGGVVIILLVVDSDVLVAIPVVAISGLSSSVVWIEVVIFVEVEVDSSKVVVLISSRLVFKESSSNPNKVLSLSVPVILSNFNLI